MLVLVTNINYDLLENQLVLSLTIDGLSQYDESCDHWSVNSEQTKKTKKPKSHSVIFKVDVKRQKRLLH